MRKFSSGIGGPSAEFVDDQFEGIVQKNIYNHYNIRNPNLDYQLQQSTLDEKLNIVRICLTGGPCAGKTTAIAEIK